MGLEVKGVVYTAWSPPAGDCVCSSQSHAVDVLLVEMRSFHGLMRKSFQETHTWEDEMRMR